MFKTDRNVKEEVADNQAGLTAHFHFHFFL